MPGLDVVRGVAIAMVILYHGFAPLATAEHDRLSNVQYAFLHTFELGAMGVHLFFVLSGFLITGILLDTRHKHDFYKRFYIRSILRIVPVYLAMIALLKLTDSISWRFTAVSLLYLCNLSGLLHSTPEYGSFWSLSVEEQFYLVWPCLVRRFSSSALLVLSVLIVIGTPVLRYVLLYAPKAVSDIHYKTWAVGDFFAAGALLSMLVRSSRHRLVMRPIANVCCIFGVPLALLAAFMPHVSFGPLLKVQEALYLTLWLPLFTGIVLIAYLVPTIADFPLARVFVFLGKISYGLYIVHSYIFSLANKYWPVESAPLLAPHLFSKLLLRFLMEMTMAIGVAFVSRVSIEEFFLRQKPQGTR